MKKVLTVFALITALALTGCSSSQKKAGPLDGYWQGKGKSVSYKKFTSPMKWAPGHYVVMGNLDDGDRTSVSKITIVRKEQGGWVFESINTDEKGKVTGMQSLIKGYEQAMAKKDPSKISAVWAKVLQEDGTVQLIEKEAMVFFSMGLKASWDKLIISGQSTTKSGAVSVPAGNFAGATAMKTTVTILFSSITSTSYFHPDVPVNGMIKSADEDGKVLSELLDYGFNGKAVIK
jgi:hypothetical protein